MAKKRLVYCVCAIVSLLLGSSFFPAIIPNHPGLSGTAMLALAWVFIDGFEKSVAWLIFLGILTDFLAGTTVGTHVITFVFIGYFASFLYRRLSVDMHGMGIIWVVFFVLASTLAMLLSAGLGGGLELKQMNLLFRRFDLGTFLVSYLLNLAIFALWYRLIKWMKKYYYF